MFSTLRQRVAHFWLARLHRSLRQVFLQAFTQAIELDSLRRAGCCSSDAEIGVAEYVGVLGAPLPDIVPTCARPGCPMPSRTSAPIEAGSNSPVGQAPASFALSLKRVGAVHHSSGLIQTEALPIFRC
jgi:hypothetical protein